MTKKELEKEAEEYALANRSMCVEGDNADLLKEVFLDVAEPREKQIQIDAEQIRALQKQNGELKDKVKGLEQQIEKMKCCGNCYYFNNSKNIGLGNLFCDLMNIKREYCENKDHWEFLRR